MFLNVPSASTIALPYLGLPQHVEHGQVLLLELLHLRLLLLRLQGAGSRRVKVSAKKSRA